VTITVHEQHATNSMNGSSNLGQQCKTEMLWQLLYNYSSNLPVCFHYCIIANASATQV